MSTIRDQMAAYLTTQRAVARATQGQGDKPHTMDTMNTVERVAAAIVATATAKAAPVVIPFPQRGEAARAAMASILSTAKARPTTQSDAERTAFYRALGMRV